MKLDKRDTTTAVYIIRRFKDRLLQHLLGGGLTCATTIPNRLITTMDRYESIEPRPSNAWHRTDAFRHDGYSGDGYSRQNVNRSIPCITNCMG